MRKKKTVCISFMVVGCLVCTFYNVVIVYSFWIGNLDSYSNDLVQFPYENKHGVASDSNKEGAIIIRYGDYYTSKIGKLEKYYMKQQQMSTASEVIHRETAQTRAQDSADGSGESWNGSHVGVDCGRPWLTSYMHGRLGNQICCCTHLLQLHLDYGIQVSLSLIATN